MRSKHLTLLLAVSLLLTQTRPAVAQAQPAAAPTQPPATAQAEKSAAPSRSQSPVPLDKRAEKVRRSVQRIGLSQTITVIIADGDDLHGTVTDIREQEFVIAEVDLRRQVIIAYADVKKVRSGYARHRDLFTGERNSPPKGTRIAAFAGLIFAVALPLIVVASMKD